MCMCMCVRERYFEIVLLAKAKSAFGEVTGKTNEDVVRA